VHGKGGSKEKRKETEVKERDNQIESPMEKGKKKKTPKRENNGIVEVDTVCQS
jgi:hypothetical protein